MIIINNVSQSEWRTILAALRCYRNDKVFKMIYGEKPKKEMDDLIKKVERTTGDYDPVEDFRIKIESKKF